MKLNNILYPALLIIGASLAAKPPTVKIKAKPFTATVELDVQFTTDSSKPVELKSSIWKIYTIKQLKAHGTVVKAGDVVLEFEPDSYNQEVETRKNSLALNSTSFEISTSQIKYLKESQKLALESAKLKNKNFNETYQHYLTVRKESNKRFLDFYLKNAVNYLKYEEEELKQLEKMYKEDAITEESEEIILTRQKEAVARLKFQLKELKIDQAESKQIKNPFYDETYKVNTEIANLGYKKTMLDIPQALKKAELTHLQLHNALLKEKAYLNKLVADKTNFQLKAPVDGILYYGRINNGSWSTTEVLRYLIPGGKITGNKTLMTIIPDGNITAYAKIPEKDRGHFLAENLSVNISANVSPNTTYKAELQALSKVPISLGYFQGKFKLVEATNLYPGMKGKLYHLVRHNETAITVYNKNIHRDGKDPGRKYVLLWSEKAKKSVRKYIKTGVQKGTYTEVLEGLKDGDEIVKTPSTS